MTEEFDARNVLKQVVQNIQGTWTSLDRRSLQAIENGGSAPTYNATEVQNMLEELLEVEVDGELKEVSYSSKEDDVRLN